MNNPVLTDSALATASTTPNRRRLIILYASAVFLYWAGLYLYAPTLPVYVKSKSDNLTIVGIILSMYGFWQAVVRLPLGIVTDWVGQRKPFILLGIVFVGLGAWIMGTAEGVWGLLIGRSITGLAAATWVPIVVIFSSLFPPEETVRATALLTLVGSLGRLVATGATGSLNQLGGYPLAFYLSSVAAFLAILILIPIPEERLPPRQPSLSAIRTLISRRDVLLPALLSAVCQYVNWAVTFGFLPILAKQLGATDMLQSMMTSLSVIVLAVGNWGASTLAKRLGAQRLTVLSFLLLFAGVEVAAFASSLPWLFVAQLLIGIGQGIGYPVLMGMSIRHVAVSERATAMGLHQAVYAIGMFAGPWLSGIAAEAWGVQTMFAVTAVGALVLGLFGARRLGHQ